MKASVLDLRRRMREVIRTLERNEPVTILHRGKEMGIIQPTATRKGGTTAVTEHPAFGMWKERDDLEDVPQVVRSLRKGRSHAL